jgi:hypothetical protein
MSLGAIDRLPGGGIARTLLGMTAWVSPDPVNDEGTRATTRCPSASAPAPALAAAKPGRVGVRLVLPDTSAAMSAY